MCTVLNSILQNLDIAVPYCTCAGHFVGQCDMYKELVHVTWTVKCFLTYHRRIVHIPVFVQTEMHNEVQYAFFVHKRIHLSK